MQKHDPMLIDTQSTDLSTLGPLYSASQVRSIDKSIIEQQGVAGIDLMRLAAEACFVAIEENWPQTTCVRIYCGSGNNAADGYILAGLLAQRRYSVQVIVAGSQKKLSEDGRLAYEFCSQSSAKIVAIDDRALIGLEAPDIVVDALLGTGFSGEVRPNIALAVDQVNHLPCPVLAIDLPAGLNSDTGQIVNCAVVADVTVTFIALKRGLFTAKGRDYTGKLYLAPLVVASSQPEFDEVVDCLNTETLRAQFPLRQKDAHKYDFGHVLVIGGDVGMGGAPIMTALAAMRAGAGLVTVATHPEHALQLSAAYPELMVRGVAPQDIDRLLSKASVVALGPGLGQSAWSTAMFAAALETTVPMVVDADGLNHLAQSPSRRDNWILTPHPGEASRLLGSSSVQEDRFASVVELQARYGGLAILKGAGTLVANRGPSGLDDKASIKLCPYGNSGMSTAGMGDVLCGVIAGLLGQSGDCQLAAEFGVALHSAAADRCVDKEGIRGLMATDLIPEVRRLLNGV